MNAGTQDGMETVEDVTERPFFDTGWPERVERETATCQAGAAAIVPLLEGAAGDGHRSRGGLR